MTTDSLIEKLEEFRTTAQQKYYHLPTVNACIAIVRKHEAEKSKGATGKDLLKFVGSIKDPTFFDNFQTVDEVAKNNELENDCLCDPLKGIKWTRECPIHGIPDKKSEILDVVRRNLLHQLNLDRPDIRDLPEGATIECNVTILRKIADFIRTTELAMSGCVDEGCPHYGKAIKCEPKEGGCIATVAKQPDGLLPCPFCGVTDIVDLEGDDVGKLGCTNCGCENNFWKWNTRPMREISNLDAIENCPLCKREGKVSYFKSWSRHIDCKGCGFHDLHGILGDPPYKSNGIEDASRE